MKKIALIGLAIMAGAILVLFILRDSMDWIPQTPRYRKLEIDSGKLVGFSDGKKIWEIYSDYIWARDNRYVFLIDELKDGRLYNKKEMVIMNNIRAKDVYVNTKLKSINQAKDIHGTLVRTTTDKDNKLVNLRAGRLRYYQEDKMAYLESGVHIESENSIIHAESATLDQNEDELRIEAPFQINVEDYTATANAVSIMMDDGMVNLKKEVKLRRAAQKEFPKGMDEREKKIREKEGVLETENLTYTDDKSKGGHIQIKGNVHIYQDDKSIKGEGATFDRKKERLVLKKNVEITLSELNWLIQKKKGESFKNERLVETLNNECHIKSDYLMINLKKKHLLLKGNVTIKQGNQEARAEVLIYNDKKNQIVLLGKTDDLVYYKKESGEVIRTRKLTADVEREEYWSDEQTTIEFDYEDGGLVF